MNDADRSAKVSAFVSLRISEALARAEIFVLLFCLNIQTRYKSLE